MIHGQQNIKSTCTNNASSYRVHSHRVHSKQLTSSFIRRVISNTKLQARVFTDISVTVESDWDRLIINLETRNFGHQAMTSVCFCPRRTEFLEAPGPQG
jgi:hypothetical protein